MRELPALQNAEILSPEQAALRYAADTGGAVRQLAGAVVVRDRGQVEAMVHWANRTGQPLWPISGGRNFGYGTSLPVQDGSVILDLSRLNHIRHMPGSQCVEIEAGVTQADLAAFIKAHDLPYMVPTTGAGPNGNLIGNALDGGYGLTPVSDHFDGLAALQGVWGSGLSFNHVFALMGARDMSSRWAAGVGPDVRGLLRQGNFGIVTQATLQLARKPEASSLVLVQWKRDADFFGAQDELSRVMEDIPQLTGLLSMTAARTLASMPGGPLLQAPAGPDRQAFIAAAASKRGMAAWTSMGTMYGSKESIAGAARDIARRLGKYNGRVLCLSPAGVKVALALRGVMPAGLRAKVSSLANALEMLEGRPVPEFLQLAYAMDEEQRTPNASSNPAKDGQGILWFAPLVALTEAGLRTYVRTVEPILEKHDFDSLLAATTRSSRICTATLPLIFKKTPEDIERAHACYEELMAACLTLGMPPYRLGIDFMPQLHAAQHVSTDMLHSELKHALDPNDVISPGRYVAPMR